MSNSNKRATSAMILMAFFLSVFLTPLSAEAQLPAEHPLARFDAMDVDGHWAAEGLLHFLYSDVVRGYVDEQGKVNLRPDQAVTRAELVTLLVRAMGLTSDLPAKHFKDVPANQWYYESVRIASSLGIVNGVGDDIFAPERHIQRDEIATLVVKAFQASIPVSGQAKSFGDVPNYWARPFIEQASQMGLISGYEGGLFKPRNPATRAEALTILYKALWLENNELPQDKALEDTVLNQEHESLALFKNKSFNQISAVVEKYSVGYYKLKVEDDYKYFQSQVEQGYEFDIIPKGEFKAKVVEKSNRFAVVELEESYEMVLKFGDYERRMTRESLDVVFLRKTTDDKNPWKVYWMENVDSNFLP